MEYQNFPSHLHEYTTPGLPERKTTYISGHHGHHDDHEWVGWVSALALIMAIIAIILLVYLYFTSGNSSSKWIIIAGATGATDTFKAENRTAYVRSSGIINLTLTITAPASPKGKMALVDNSVGAATSGTITIKYSTGVDYIVPSGKSVYLLWVSDTEIHVID